MRRLFRCLAVACVPVVVNAAEMLGSSPEAHSAYEALQIQPVQSTEDFGILPFGRGISLGDGYDARRIELFPGLIMDLENNIQIPLIFTTKDSAERTPESCIWLAAAIHDKILLVGEVEVYEEGTELYIRQISGKKEEDQPEDFFGDLAALANSRVESMQSTSSGQYGIKNVGFMKVDPEAEPQQHGFLMKILFNILDPNFLTDEFCSNTQLAQEISAYVANQPGEQAVAFCSTQPSPEDERANAEYDLVVFNEGKTASSAPATRKMNLADLDDILHRVGTAQGSTVRVSFPHGELALASVPAPPIAPPMPPLPMPPASTTPGALPVHDGGAFEDAKANKIPGVLMQGQESVRIGAGGDAGMIALVPGFMQFFSEGGVFEEYPMQVFDHASGGTCDSESCDWLAASVNRNQFFACALTVHKQATDGVTDLYLTLKECRSTGAFPAVFTSDLRDQANEGFQTGMAPASNIGVTGLMWTLNKLDEGGNPGHYTRYGFPLRAEVTTPDPANFCETQIIIMQEISTVLLLKFQTPGVKTELVQVTNCLVGDVGAGPRIQLDFIFFNEAGTPAATAVENQLHEPLQNMLMTEESRISRAQIEWLDWPNGGVSRSSAPLAPTSPPVAPTSPPVASTFPPVIPPQPTPAVQPTVAPPAVIIRGSSVDDPDYAQALAQITNRDIGEQMSPAGPFGLGVGQRWEVMKTRGAGHAAAAGLMVVAFMLVLAATLAPWWQNRASSSSQSVPLVDLEGSMAGEQE